jgi:hypothetical protein
MGGGSGRLPSGHPEVVDADLADYFGSIPHAELLKSVARRIVDRRVLHLIKMWLETRTARRAYFDVIMRIGRRRLARRPRPL